jgi:GNAT superfamily N-acetyltransferase
VAQITAYNEVMATTIRPATRDDVSTILAFIRALAAYEREPDAAVATEEDLLRDGFGDNPYYSCILAEQDGSPAGFAFYFFDYSTWLGRPGLYLEDLFVHPEFRGLGIGKALLQRVAAIAVEKGCARMKWEVLDWNTPAIDFYAAMGAEFLDTWRNVRLSGDALQRLAEPPDYRAPSFRQLSGERVGGHEPQPSFLAEEGPQ